MKHFFLFSFAAIITTFCLGQPHPNQNIIIITDYSNVSDLEHKTNDKMKIHVMDMDGTIPKPQVEPFEPTIASKHFIWHIPTSKAKRLAGPILGFSRECFAMPGDSIYIRFRNSDAEFSGKGATKFHLVYTIEKLQKSIVYPVPLFRAKSKTGEITKTTLSVKEYLLLNKYYDDQINAAIKTIDQEKQDLSQIEYDWLRATFIYTAENARRGAFGVTIFNKNLKFGTDTTYSIQFKAALWDSTMNKPHAVWLRSQHNLPGLTSGYFYGFSKGEVWRKFLWNIANNDTLASKPMRVKMIYDQLVKNYNGLRLEQAVATQLLDEEVTQEMGAWHPMSQRLLKDYYHRSSYPAYKRWVKSLEKERQYYTAPYGIIPFFQLETPNQEIFTEKDIEGKFAVINFWYTGCKECSEKVTALQHQQEKLKQDTNVVFMNICVDTDKKIWQLNKDSGIYAPKGGIQLYAGAKGKNNDLLKDLNIEKYPSVRLFRPNGTMVFLNKDETDQIKNNEHWLENLVSAQKSYPEDGPYVIKVSGKRKALYIQNNKVISQSAAGYLKAGTDQADQMISFTLQKEIIPPPSEYPSIEKIFVLSDIEGNFSAFRKLLLAGGIIDKNFNWTFGKGHLVFAGDMFDRGEQVTECLWLIYSLEEKAKKMGGMVHFILGNHEIMNLNGQDRYVKDKYKSNYQLLGKTLAELYGTDSELGRWLRSKNIVEKIGDYLFCHGGISPYVNNLDITLDGINQKARPYYDKSDEAHKSDDNSLSTLFNVRKSPFWYRQYYDKDYFSKSNNEMIWHASERQVDSTCKKFGVKHIITGHTIIADTISMHYNGKIFNTDVHHAEGKSEALLIENNSCYRIDYIGRRKLIYTKNEEQDTMNVINISAGQ